MVAVHPPWLPSRRGEVAAGHEPAGLEQEHQIAVAAVAEADAELGLLLVGENAAAGERRQPLDHQRAGTLGEEPEAGHRGVVDREVVVGHAEPERLDVAREVVVAAHRGHPVVGEEREAGPRIAPEGRRQQLAEPGLVDGELLLERRVVRDVAVEEGVDLAQIDEEQRRAPGLDVVTGAAQDLGVGPVVVRVRAMRHTRDREPVEDRGDAADAVRLIDVALLDPVEPWEHARAHRAVEQRPEPEGPPAHFLDRLAHDTVAEDSVRQEMKPPQPAERRTLRIVVEEVPVSMLGRRLAGEHGGDRARAVAEHGPERRPVRQRVGQEAEPLRDLPPEGVDQHEHVEVEAVDAAHAPSR